MQVERITTFDQTDELESAWRRLAGNRPFRDWPWNYHWWKSYGAPAGEPRTGLHQQELYVLLVRNVHGRIVGIAPWYLHHSRFQGRVIRFLGTGEVCSDHLGLLCEQDSIPEITLALAHWLVDQQAHAGNLRHNLNTPRQSPWDLLQLEAVEAKDMATFSLLQHLDDQGLKAHSVVSSYCWQLSPPEDWEEYLRQLSKNHRKQIRRLDRIRFASGDVQVHWVTQLDEIPRAVDHLIQLHQQRWQSVGEPGCFSSARFERFHREVIPELWKSGQLQLLWLEYQGRPIAAEYQILGPNTVYAYQAGFDPNFLEMEPGRLAAITFIRQAIESKKTTIDFLRGNESYKSHWRAKPQAQLTIEVVSSRLSAKVCHQLKLTGTQIKHWVKRGLEITGVRASKACHSHPLI